MFHVEYIYKYIYIYIYIYMFFVVKKKQEEKLIFVYVYTQPTISPTNSYIFILSKISLLWSLRASGVNILSCSSATVILDMFQVNKLGMALFATLMTQLIAPITLREY